MPLKTGNKDIPRLRVGSEKIKRAYQGNKLVYGLYDVYYYDREGINTSSYTPKEYAWGYKDECIELPKPLKASDYVEEDEYGHPTYITHYGNSLGTNGWYTNSNLTIQKSGSINKVDLDDKQDFDFYARWRQHRYSYDGVISYLEWVPGSGEGGDDPGGGGDDPGGDTPVVINGLFEFASQWNGSNSGNLVGKGTPAWQGVAGNWCAEFTWWSFANVTGNSNYYLPPSIIWNDPIATSGSQQYRAWGFMCAIWTGQASGEIIGFDSKNGGIPQKDDLVIFYDPIHEQNQTDWAHVGICSGKSYGSDDYEYISGNLGGSVVTTGIKESIRVNSGTGWSGYVLVRGFKLN